MLKRFLKFLKGDDSAVAERFEGSYLDHLLEQVHPIVTEQLAECPDHDPLLLVVTGILRHTMMNVWDPRTTAPLLDSQSPGVPDGFCAPAAETAEFEAYQDEIQFEVEEPLRDTLEIEAVEVEPSEVDDLEEDDSEPHADTIVEDDEDEQESDESDDDADSEDSEDDEDLFGSEGESLDEESVASIQKHFEDDDDEEEPPPAPTGSTRITEEIDISEIRASANEGNLDATLELDRDAILADDKQPRRPRVDTEDVLQAGRLYLALLIENDRLPTDLQLSVAETMLARDMLLGYFIGSDEVADNAHRILALVEEKFRDGLFGQARILLELFHTDEHTWVQEEHKIFYEDMILKLGIRRRNRLSESEIAAFNGHIDRATENNGVYDLASWLSRQCMVSFHLYLRDPDRVQSWQTALEPSDRDGARDNFELYIPPRRWRPVESYESLQPSEQVTRHIGSETARMYVLNHLKTAFVVLRAHGDTGLEVYLDAFFDWSERVLDFNATLIMPELYRRSMMDSEPMESILESAYDEYFEELVDARLDEFDESTRVSAMFSAIAKLREADIADVAPGYYDLGGFVLDELLEFKHPDPQFPFKIHRLS